MQLFFFTEGWLAANGFQLLLPPALLVLVSGVHVLGTNRAAIRFTQRVHELAQAHGFFAEEGVAGVENGLLVGIGKAVKGWIQFRNFVALCALERVQVSPACADVAVR